MPQPMKKPATLTFLPFALPEIGEEEIAGDELATPRKKADGAWFGLRPEGSGAARQPRPPDGKAVA